MLRRTAFGLVVVLLVVTAGCVGGNSDPGPISDTSEGGAGGDSGDGGAAALVENRTAALEAAGSYTSVWRMRTYEDGAQVSEMAYETAMDYANQRYGFEMRSTSEGTTRTSAASYYADGTSYQRLGEGEDAQYMANDVPFGQVAKSGRAAFVAMSGDLDGFTRTGTETFDGVGVTRYEMGSTAPWLSGQGQDGVQWTDFSYVVLVDDQGLVRSERWTGTGVDDAGVERSVEFTYELTGVGSTEVPEPAWLDLARA